MTMKDEELSRLRAAFAAPIPAARGIGSCPAPDRIWEAVRGELPPEEVRAVVDHVALCASCAEDWRIAAAFAKESQAHEGEEPARVRPFPARRLQPWIYRAAAAILLVAAAGGIYRYQQTQRPQETGETAEYRGERPQIESRTPESLSRRSFLLRWAPVAGAESYELLVTRPDDLSTIADLEGLAAPQHQVPTSALAALPAGTQLQWQVTAVFPDGRRERFRTFRIELLE